MADKYILQVTAGPAYDSSTHHVVNVNSPKPSRITSPRCTLDLFVRVQNYHGLPRSSPETSPYFSHTLHQKDQYSISFRLTPHQSIPGPSLVFGNDFDKPVRDRLPPGFGTAFRIVKWGIDPGLDGDMYADEPYLYGCALSSFNIINVGDSNDKGEHGHIPFAGQNDEKAAEEAEAPITDKTHKHNDDDPVILEGGTESGHRWRQERDVPDAPDARKKWALTPAHQDKWVWEAGREYGFDFFNPYLDFNKFALKLPGFSLSLMGYLGGEDFLRYALKNKETGEVFFVVIFSLLHREDVEKREREEKEEEQKRLAQKEKVDGEGEREREQGKREDREAETGKETEKEEAKRESVPEQAGGKGFEPQADDVD